MRFDLGRYCFAIFTLLCSITSLKINNDDWRNLLTPLELSSILGDSVDSESANNCIIAYPNFVELDGNKKKVDIDVPEFGHNFSLVLKPNDEIVSRDFLVLETFANGSHPVILQEKEKSCYFKSESAALSLCDGVRGLVHIDEEHFFLINPLPKRFHTARLEPHLLIKKRHRHQSLPTENDTKDNIRDAKAKKDVISTKKVRVRRETFPEGAPAFVETAVFVDKDLFEHMKTNFPVNTERELIRFVLAMINAVQLLYHDPSLGRPVNFVLKRLEILKEEVSGLVRPPDIDRFLSNFCNWQKTKNPSGDSQPLHWDHALILTGLDLYVRGKHGKISNQVVGLAPVAGMCTATSSCTVNEGRHFESVYVVAHEIGHNLGMRHDGPLAENDCDPSSYIMSPTLGSGKITWSTCSKRYLQKFLDSPQSRCLLDHGSSAGKLDHSAEGALPGERFDANQQCMLKYGRGSKHSTQQALNDVCRDLHCERERYTWTSHPALEGTLCGISMWCRGGQCLAKGQPHSAAYTSTRQQSASARLGRVDGGWSRWQHFGECASGCLFGEEGRLRSGSTGIMVAERMCNNPRPQGTGNNCEGHARRYTSCTAQQCQNVPRLTIREFADQICRRAKEIDPDLSGSGMQKVSSMRPQGTGNKCEGHARRYTSCTAQQCQNVPRLTIREFADQICRRAKEIDPDLSGSGMQKVSSDPEEACLVWCQKKNGSPKSRGWTFPDGTACQIRRNRYGKTSYCIKGRCEEFVCDPSEEAAHALPVDLCPTAGGPDDDGNELEGGGRGTTGLRGREGPQRWKSASGCHYNCVSPGAGIRLVHAKKKGNRASIQLCRPEQLHASMVCSKYKERVSRLSGLGMQILPAVEDPDRPCRIACQDDYISHRFYLVNGEDGWFPFGTDCSRGSSDKKAYCVSGKCLEFGADDTPLSESEFTLPLLSRSRRSLYSNGTTRILAKLNQMELDNIIRDLHRTLSGNSTGPKFDIDFKNPIHVNMDVHYSPKRMQNGDDYINYA